jgi:hypothetical protein
MDFGHLNSKVIMLIRYTGYSFVVTTDIITSFQGEENLIL